MNSNRESFASRMGFILISAGCAIGLGNVWRFPFITGQYGGAAFVVIYLFFLLVFGLPILMVNAVATSTGPSMAIPASSVTVSGCGANECTYTVKDGSSIVGGPTTYNSGYNLYFTGATAPGKHDYTVSIKHGEDDAVNCTGTYTVNYAAASSGGVSTTGSIGCTFSKLTLDLGQSFTLTPSYGGSCWTSALTGSGTSGAAGCANRYEITPLAIGTQRYTYTVTSGDKGEASCVADVTVNDVVVTGSVEISSKGVDTEVPCRKTIVVSTTTDENNGTGLYCSGSFDKTVGSSRRNRRYRT